MNTQHRYRQFGIDFGSAVLPPTQLSQMESVSGTDSEDELDGNKEETRTSSQPEEMENLV